MSQAVAIIKNVDTSLLPSSVQPMAKEVTDLFRAVDNIDEADMAEYKEFVIQQFTDEDDKKLCKETISEIEGSVDTFTESIIDHVLDLINHYKNKDQGRVELIEGGKRRRKGGGKEDEILQGFVAFIIFFIILKLFQVLSVVLGTSVDYVGTSIGNLGSKLFPKKPKSSGPTLASGAMSDMYSNPYGRHGGKKSRRQRRKRTVKRR
jgi:hypothetical protein